MRNSTLHEITPRSNTRFVGFERVVAVFHGVDIVVTAFASIFKNWAVALRILLLPLVVLISVNVWANQPEYQFSSLGEIIATLVDLLFLTVVAVGWHRFALLGEYPGPIGPRLPAKSMFAYFLSWFALMLVISFSFTAFGAAFFFAFNYLGGTGAFDSLLEVFSWGNDFVWQGAILLGFASIWAITYALFRLGLRLPARAALGKSVGLDASRVLTKPIAGALAVASALIAGLTIIVAYLPKLLLPSAALFSGVFTTSQVIVANFGYGLTVLIGAAVLNEIFRRSVPQDELARELE